MVWYGMVWCGGAGAILMSLNAFYIHKRYKSTTKKRKDELMSLSINFDGKANVSKKVGNSNTKIMDTFKNAQVKTVDTKEIRAEMARLGISGEHVKMNDQAQNVKISNTEIMDTFKNAQVKTVDAKEIGARSEERR